MSDIWRTIRRMSGLGRKVEMPVLCSSNKNAVSNVEKAELLVETFVKIHISGNLSTVDKQHRNQTLLENSGIKESRTASGGDMDLPFTMFELKRAILNARQTTPGKDAVCYSMLGHIKDVSLEAVLRLINMIWNAGRIPLEWKQRVIVPIL